jgi:N-succinyldiaminopimelate aminotransferase
MNRVPYLVSRLQGFGTTIFAEMSALAVETGAINLGQGFPDTDGPELIVEAAIRAIREGHNQYPPGRGIAPLREAISAHQSRFYGTAPDPATEVLVTAGATEAIAACLLALCEAGDEVVAFDPAYDSYAAATAMAGARFVTVTLRPPGYGFDPDEFEAAVNDKTRLLLINTPHNPTGKVLTPEELGVIARIAIERDLIVVTDEVYEHMVFDGGQHVPIATLPGMAERTLTISSAGKTFAMTGWKIGWVTGPAALINAVTTAKQFLTYVNGAPFQPAVAEALGMDDDYYLGLARGLEERRDVLCDGLDGAGFEVYRPEGTYFVTCDIRPLGYDDGFEFCRQLPHKVGVVAVPNVVFYQRPDEGRHLVRFAFPKKLAVLEEAARRLRGMTQRD